MPKDVTKDVTAPPQAKSLKLPAAVYDRLAGIARELRVDVPRLLELAARRASALKLLAHGELAAQVHAEFEAARRRAAKSDEGPPAGDSAPKSASRPAAVPPAAPAAPASVAAGGGRRA